MIEIITGDDVEVDVVVNTQGVQGVIDKVYFTCEKLQLQKILTFDADRNIYVIKIPHHETEVLKPITTTYDITVVFVGNKISTAAFNEQLVVRDKINEVTAWTV